MNPAAAYLYYKEQIEKNIDGQEPVHSVLSVETRIKYPDPSKVKAYDEEIIGKTKNGFSSVIFMRATGNIGGNMKDSEESIKTYRSDFGNAITKRLAALHAYLKGFVPTALSEEEHGKFLGLMKTYEIKAKKIQSKVSFDVDNMLLISSEINSEALSKFKNDKEKASKFLKEISIVTEYFIPIVDGKRLNVSKVANLAKSRHETDRKKTIPIGPVSTNYDKSQMAGLAEKANYKRGTTMKKSELIKMIKEETSNLLFEQENWDKLTQDYYKIRMNASGGNAGQLTMRRVRQHVAKAKSMTDGYAKLVAYIKKKYPEDQLAQNLGAQ